MSDQTEPLIRTMIYISGEVFEQEALTNILGVFPTDVGTKGQLRSNGKSHHQETYWKYSKDIYDYSINDALKVLLREVLPFKNKLNEYVTANILEVSLICNVTITEERPIYQIEKDVIDMMSAIGAEFLMDIFDYSK